MKVKLFLLVALLGLAGCTPLVPSEYIKSVENVSKVSWGENYQAAYRKIVRKSEECFERGTVSGFRVERDLFPDTQEGRVSIFLEGLASRSVLLFVLDIKPATKDETEIMVYSYYANYAKRASVWLTDLSNGKNYCF